MRSLDPSDAIAADGMVLCTAYMYTYILSEISSLMLDPVTLCATMLPRLKLTLSHLSPQVPFLGVRKKDERGKLGPYSWMTYSQVTEQGGECLSFRISLKYVSPLLGW